MTLSADLGALVASGLLDTLDVHFAASLARLAGEQDARVVLAAALASRQVQAGHVCLDLRRLCDGELSFEADELPPGFRWPALDAWLVALRDSALLGPEDGDTPLYLDRSARLYLRRYVEYERVVAQSLRSRAALRPAPIDARRLRAGLARLFGGASSAGQAQLPLFAEQPASETDREPDLQRDAAERAVLRNLCVISGGPGTGKTSTVVKILALLAEQALSRGRPAPRTHLLAPTGKAAARLSEAIQRAKAELPISNEVRRAIADQASTIHRALGVIPGSQRFAHDREAPLATDVVVVDEASMVDLALMARLLDAVPIRARTILLGDKNQLASVEAGAVLGDICGTGAKDPGPGGDAPLTGCVVHLTRSYRYGARSGIQQLAAAINGADVSRVLALLDDPGLPDVRRVDPAEDGAAHEALLAASLANFEAFFAAGHPSLKLDALGRYRVLCAHRRGPHGQLAINAAIEAAARHRGAIPARGERYPGRPILITQNDAQAKLFNGDVGVLVADPERSGGVNACFRAADDQLRVLGAARLPAHESVYAMSVHKSQGSEFDRVAIVLPAEPSPVLTRELLYTAVTRARENVTIYASAELIGLAVGRAVQRASGLRARLWG